MKNKLVHLLFTMLCCAFILNAHAQLPIPTVNLIAGKVYFPGTSDDYPVCSPGVSMVLPAAALLLFYVTFATVQGILGRPLNAECIPVQLNNLIKKNS